MTQPEVDGVSCSATGVCVRMAPGMFRLVDRDGLEVAEVIPDGTASEEDLWAAAHGCPWQAVRLRSDDGDLLFPKR